MTEFEVHRLIMLGRPEFDDATLIVFGINVVFMLLALSCAGKYSRAEANLMSIVCVAGSLFFTMRAISAIVRFTRLFELLENFELVYDPSTLYLQWPTLIFRLIIFMALPIISVKILRTKASN